MQSLVQSITDMTMLSYTHNTHQQNYTDTFGTGGNFFFLLKFNIKTKKITILIMKGQNNSDSTLYNVKSDD